MFKHVLTKAALVLPAAALVVFGVTSAASASPGPSAGPPSSHSANQGHIKYSYPIGDTYWSCTGAHVVNKGAGTLDSETCQVTGVTAGDIAAWPAGTYSNDPGSIGGPFPFAGYYAWLSDFNQKDVASSWTMTVSYDATGGADGLATVTVLAYY